MCAFAENHKLFLDYKKDQVPRLQTCPFSVKEYDMNSFDLRWYILFTLNILKKTFNYLWGTKYNPLIISHNIWILCDNILRMRANSLRGDKNISSGDKYL